MDFQLVFPYSSNKTLSGPVRLPAVGKLRVELRFQLPPAQVIFQYKLIWLSESDALGWSMNSFNRVRPLQEAQRPAPEGPQGSP